MKRLLSELILLLATGIIIVLLILAASHPANAGKLDVELGMGWVPTQSGFTSTNPSQYSLSCSQYKNLSGSFTGKCSATQVGQKTQQWGMSGLLSVDYHIDDQWTIFYLNLAPIENRTTTAGIQMTGIKYRFSR